MKKLFFIIAFMTFLSIGSYAAEYNLDETSRISDNSIYTNIAIKAGDKITIESDLPIDALYFVYNESPTSFEIDIDGEVYLYDENIFLHSFIKLPTDAIKLTVTFLSDSVLCYIAPQEAGGSLAIAEHWQPTTTDADLLVVSTHGDDEYLFFGGTIPYYAGERGLRVQLLYLTNHGITGEPYRMHEILSGLYSSGVRLYPIFSDFPDYFASSLDGAAGIYGADAFIDLIVDSIRYTHPEVIVGHDIDGEYGHGVHILGTDNLMDAVPLAADENYGNGDIHTVQKLYLHLYPENYIKLDFNIPLDHFDGKTAHDMGAIGYSYHRSQHTWFSYDIDSEYDNAAFGLYYTAVGLDNEADDFFENVKFPLVLTDGTRPAVTIEGFGLRN